jgi:endosialidase-like protein
MGGKSEQTETKKQDSKTEPWAPAQPLLMSILGKAGGLSTDVTPGQQAGLTALQAGAAGIPQLGPQAANVATGLLGSKTNPLYSGMLSEGLAGLKGVLQPFASGANVGPNGNPALRGYLDVARDDVADDIRGRFAAAGRDFSGAESGSIARGITAAEAPILASQYNTDVQNQMNAANAIYNATGGTAGALQGLDQQTLANQIQGLGAAGSLGGIYSAPGAAQLGAANTANALPWQNLGMLSGTVLPIAGLGAQSSGTSTTTQSQETPWYTTALGLGMGGLGALGQSGAFGQQGWMTGANGLFGGAGSVAGAAGATSPMAIASMFPQLAMFSDERLKEDIQPVGMLFDDTPVYRYRYKGDPVPRIGLLAQEIEMDRPEAVTEVGGFKAVNYGRATDRAAALGMLAGVI